MESEQIQAEAAPTAPPEPDFARIAQEAPQSTLAERLGTPALAWGVALLVAALLSLGALWLRNERDVNQAMEVVAGSTRGDVPAQAPSAPPTVAAALAASTLPPLVMLPPPPETKARLAAAAIPPPARRAATATAAPVKPLAKVRPAVRTAQPTLAARAPRPAAKPPRSNTRVAARPARRAPAVAVHKKPVTSAKLNLAVAQRCKTGDLARECLASLCRQGKKGDAACQALSNLDH